MHADHVYELLNEVEELLNVASLKVEGGEGEIRSDKGQFTSKVEPIQQDYLSYTSACANIYTAFNSSEGKK